jgi:hypothetical protein
VCTLLNWTRSHFVPLHGCRRGRGARGAKTYEYAIIGRSKWGAFFQRRIPRPIGASSTSANHENCLVGDLFASRFDPHVHAKTTFYYQVPSMWHSSHKVRHQIGLVGVSNYWGLFWGCSRIYGMKMAKVTFLRTIGWTRNELVPNIYRAFDDSVGRVMVCQPGGARRKVA